MTDKEEDGVTSHRDGTRHAFDLKPCPWCGGPADIEEIGGRDGAGASFSVGCHDGDGSSVCFGYQSLTQFARKSEAIAAWNKRPSPPPVLSNWRGIETAPKLTRVLGYWPSRDTCIVYLDSDGDWTDAQHDRIVVMDPPTHWQPLPAPPGAGNEDVLALPRDAPSDENSTAKVKR